MGPGANGRGRSMTTEIVIGSVLPPIEIEVTDDCLRSTVQLSPRCALVTTRAL